MLIEALTHYYGIDWLAFILSMLMIYHLGNKNRIGFYFGISANLTWFIFAIMASSPPIFLSHVIFFALNVRGINKWRSAKIIHPTGVIS